MFTIHVQGQCLACQEKMLLRDLQERVKATGAVAAKVNNRFRELDYYVNYDCTVEFIDLKDFDGCRVYETSLRFLMIMAIESLYPETRVEFNQFFSKSLFCRLTDLPVPLNKEYLARLEARMRELVNRDADIVRRRIPLSEAIALYQAKGYLDKVEILKYRPEPNVNLYECDGYTNYMFGYMVPSMGYLKTWRLTLFGGGIVLQTPRAEMNGGVPRFRSRDLSYYRMLQDASAWSATCGLRMLADLNHHVEEGRIADIVNICETRQTNDLAELGAIIKRHADALRIVAIAGPSSSGKTTSSNRIRLELMSRGLQPIRLSLDDYYIDRDRTPLDAQGKPDYESLHAIDIPFFNQTMASLLAGETVVLPRYDFKSGTRAAGKTVALAPGGIIIVEGNHALNPELFPMFASEEIYRIYISPTPQIQIDAHNPIRASEIRQLRRIVRDVTFRHISPEKTLLNWPSVRAGEDKWIYPYQKNADYVLNTTLNYELAVMKKHALEALSAIPKDSPAFVLANRLVKFLKYIKDIPDEAVPNNSLLREFIGGSVFYDEEGVLLA